MNPVYKSLVLTVAFAFTVLLLLFLSAPDDEAPDTGAARVPNSPSQNAVVAPADGRKFYFDVIGHSADDFYALLDRAHMIYEQTPLAARADLEIVFVLHGPDIDFFAAPNYSKYQNIVDLSAKLDAFGVFDFKMCTKSATSLGLAESEVPPFIEFVPYGPDAIDRMNTEGFVQL
jgi:uncharacterized protein